MVRWFVFSLLFVTFLACEDKKKNPPTQESQVEKKVAKDSLPKKKEAKTTSEKREYPVITEENLVSFLTQYGKDNPETKIKISTNHGDIFLELYEDTPLHRANFVYLVKQGYFDGTFFHRVVPNFIIQGGNSDNIKTNRKRKKLGPSYRLPAELENGRTHQYGTVSGAKEYRKNPDKKTAPYEFFIYLGPPEHTAHLNGNYTIFARVTEGMDVVEKIANLPRDEGEWPLQNVYIKAEIVE